VTPSFAIRVPPGAADLPGRADETRSPLRAAPEPAALEAASVTRRFGDVLALDGVSLAVTRGEVHALLGPNGAGKTTLLRAFTGLVAPTSGAVRVIGRDASRADRWLRALTGFVPSGDRTFYLRLSGYENLKFFARLHALPRRDRTARTLTTLERVGLADSAHRPVSTYSHGMQKRLSLARALLMNPSVMLIDEATHDLDPAASSEVRSVVEELAQEGTAILWATQRIDEIRGFASSVTLLAEGRVRFAGSVQELMARADAPRFVLGVRSTGGVDAEALNATLGGSATIAPVDAQHVLLTLGPETLLGDAMCAMTRAGAAVVSCNRERSEIEQAFVALTAGAGE